MSYTIDAIEGHQTHHGKRATQVLGRDQGRTEFSDAIGKIRARMVMENLIGVFISMI